MAFVIEQMKQKRERLPDWYEAGPQCDEGLLDKYLAWYSRAKTLRTSGMDGLIIDELRLEEFARRRLGIGDRMIEFFIITMMQFVYVENAFSKNSSWEYGDAITETSDDGYSNPPSNEHRN